MATTPHTGSEPPLSTLVEGIVADSQKLISQQIELVREEVRQDIRQLKNSALSMGAGAGLATLAGVLSAQMLVHLVHKSTRLPLWGSYGVVGGLMGAAAAGLFRRGEMQIANLQVAPQATESLKENAAWLK